MLFEKMGYIMQNKKKKKEMIKKHLHQKNNIIKSVLCFLKKMGYIMQNKI